MTQLDVPHSELTLAPINLSVPQLMDLLPIGSLRNGSMPIEHYGRESRWVKQLKTTIVQQSIHRSAKQYSVLQQISPRAPSGRLRVSLWALVLILTVWFDLVGLSPLLYLPSY